MKGWNAVLEVNENNFEQEVLKSSIPVVVDYWAGWCAPCKALAPIFEKVSQTFAGRMKFAKCNIDDHQNIAQENGVMSIPCMIVFKNGIEAGRIVGNQTEDSLVQRLKALL